MLVTPNVRSLGYGQYGRDDRSKDDRRGPRHGYSEMQGKRFVNIGAEVCGVTEVRIIVRGDNVTINDVDLLFGNGATQDIQVRKAVRVIRRKTQ